MKALAVSFEPKRNITVYELAIIMRDMITMGVKPALFYVPTEDFGDPKLARHFKRMPDKDHEMETPDEAMARLEAAIKQPAESEMIRAHTNPDTGLPETDDEFMARHEARIAAKD